VVVVGILSGDTGSRKRGGMRRRAAEIVSACSRNIILSVPNCMKSASSAELLRRMRAEKPKRWEKDGGGRRFRMMQES
jgi:hypothetical protein